MTPIVLLLVAVYLGTTVVAQITPVPKIEITPIPIDKTDPNVKEFQRMDANKDNQLTFAEFILSDRPFLEHQSRRFHNFDLNGDGIVTKKEFEDYHKKLEKTKRRTDLFFNKFNRERRDPFDSSFFQGPFEHKLDDDGGSRELHNPPMMLL
ncbi:unnamed protein product [Caenorhabditis bovis]|uniref:EF-hand domain-containing protein n=1 Tax=Caenorhabditis bovis TaxID=2654633 RepID=A0A8S1F4J3_9PELO|nr:unnamed protein product [Caenorhabditis bovis]